MSLLEWTGAASTVEDAVKKGLKKLGLAREQVEIKVLGEKTSGLFSLFGFRRMEVKLVEKPGARRHEREGRSDRDGRREGNRGERSAFGRDRGSRDRDGRGSAPRDDSRRGNGRDAGRGDSRRPDDRSRNDRPSGDRNRDNRGPRNDGFQRGDRPQNNNDRGFRNDRPARDDRSSSGEFRNDRPPRRDEPRQDRRPDSFRSEPRRDDRPRNDSPRGDAPRNDNFRDDRRRDAPPPSREGNFRSRPQRDDSQRAPQEPPTPDALLTQWKALLGWDDISWSPKNGETGDITLVLDAASGEKLSADGARLLEPLQHLLNVVRAKSDRSAPRVFLEIEGQAAQDENRIVDEARHAADEVKRTGEPFRMDPMGSRDRRVVHQTLANDPDVETASEGEGQWRKVVVRLKTKTAR